MTVSPQNRVGLPRINEPAPDFTAPTTDGVKALSDYGGKLIGPDPGSVFPTC